MLVESVAIRAAVVRPGLFESLAALLGARITHDLWSRVSMSGFCFLLLVFVTAALAYGSRAVDVLLVVLIVVLLAGLLVPALAGGRGGGATEVAGIDVGAARRVGSYDTTVLRAESPDALSEWLASNGFAELGAANSGDREAVADYVDKKWCFFAAKLVRDEGGAATPHPILLEFAAAEAVYPLRLTAFAESETTFDVYAVGEKQAVFPGLHTALADSFSWSGDDDDYRWDARVWAADTVGARIGHPDLARLLWDGCVVTRFTGRLSPDDMREDVLLGWKGLTPHRDRKYSTLGAAYTGVLVFFALGAGGMIVALFARWRDFGKGGDRRQAFQALLVPLGSSAIVGLSCFIIAPTVPVVTGGRWHPRMADRSRRAALGLHMRDALADKPSVTVAQARAALSAGLVREDQMARGALQRNPHTRGETRIEASLGNFDVRESEGAVRVEYFDRFARPRTCWPPPPEADP
jgi:hypothetical protein